MFDEGDVGNSKDSMVILSKINETNHLYSVLTRKKLYWWKHSESVTLFIPLHTRKGERLMEVKIPLI